MRISPSSVIKETDHSKKEIGLCAFRGDAVVVVEMLREVKCLLRSRSNGPSTWRTFLLNLE